MPPTIRCRSVGALDPHRNDGRLGLALRSHRRLCSEYVASLGTSLSQDPAIPLLPIYGVQAQDARRGPARPSVLLAGLRQSPTVEPIDYGMEARPEGRHALPCRCSAYPCLTVRLSRCEFLIRPPSRSIPGALGLPRLYCAMVSRLIQRMRGTPLSAKYSLAT